MVPRASRRRRIRRLIALLAALLVGCWLALVRHWLAGIRARDAPAAALALVSDDKDVGLNFSALRLCRDTHYRLSCVNDSHCRGPCVHKRDGVLELPFDFAPTRARVQAYKAQSATRRARLQAVVDALDGFTPHGHRNLIMLMTFNLGYGYQFINWICSMQAHNVSLDAVRPHLLVIATDAGAMAIVKRFGFFVWDPSPFIQWAGAHARITPRASRMYGADSHQALNLVSKFGMVADLVLLGLDVFSMDTDVVWTANVIPLLYETCGTCHGVFISDGRPFGVSVRAWKARNNDSEPFMRQPVRPTHEPCDAWPSSSCWYPQLNTGLFMLRAGPQTARFVSTLLDAAPLQAWKLTDQLVYNTLAYHVAFAHMRWAVLPSRRFVPGGYLHVGRHPRPFPRVPELAAVHPSDANRHTDKIEKLGRLGHWYLSREQCPAGLATCKSLAGCLPDNFTGLVSAVRLLDEADAAW